MCSLSKVVAPSVLVLALAVFGTGCSAASETAPAIRLDTVGYLPAARKQATVAAHCENFSIVRVGSGETVFSGRVSEPLRDDDTEETLWIADFSELRATGEFQLVVPEVGESEPFRISDQVYRDAFRTTTRAMYLWRCGTSVRGEYKGDVFEHVACHLEDAWLDYVSGSHERRDGTGGWHDAGDYNKYVVNAGVTVGVMLRAWERFGSEVTEVDLGTPESGGPIPDFLAEIKWETDWLLKMQAEDGSVYHKVSTRGFCGFIMPEDEKDERYFVPWASDATADFVAMMAAMSRNIRPYDSEYADRCLQAAEKSYEFLKAHPEQHWADMSDFRTGGYRSPDTDERLWAAAELWETTGDAAVLRDFETRARAIEGRFDEIFDWPVVADLGLLTYLDSTRPGRDSKLVEQIRTNLLSTADAIVRKGRAGGYGRVVGKKYSWGVNGCVARATVLLQAANQVSPKSKYTEASLDCLHHLFGRNVFGRSYVTGIGALPPMHPHARRCAGDNVEAPWPGYLVGGPNPHATDWHDDEKDFRTNEIAINWNAALIFALAGFLK